MFENIKKWWSLEINKITCPHEYEIDYFYSNGVCREPYYWCPDCKRGIEPEGIEFAPGEWRNRTPDDDIIIVHWNPDAPISKECLKMREEFEATQYKCKI